MLNVLFTIDVEVWCDGWQDIDRKFPDAFGRLHPRTGGEYGLAFPVACPERPWPKGKCVSSSRFLPGASDKSRCQK